MFIKWGKCKFLLYSDGKGKLSEANKKICLWEMQLVPSPSATHHWFTLAGDEMGALLLLNI